MMDLVSASVPIVWCTEIFLRDTSMVALMDKPKYSTFPITFCSQVRFFGDRVGVVSGGGVTGLLEPYVGDFHVNEESCGSENLKQVKYIHVIE